ncbi:c-type cytochrome [Humitalea sp. 24SJ18S-53]|uniref:c-type cytochrome n=1 Tax=Humitalea sp. 24SJ18S-53 TaxID=3422307 RepID=UPI003D675902
MRALVAAALLAAIPAAAAERGQAIFEARCAACHAADRAAPPGAGPNLAGLIGRRVGGDPRFDYSSVLASAGQVWSGPLLDRFLADPEEMFPGLWMGGNGLRDADDRAAVVRFLAGTH